MYPISNGIFLTKKENIKNLSNFLAEQIAPEREIFTYKSGSLEPKANNSRNRRQVVDFSNTDKGIPQHF